MVEKGFNFNSNSINSSITYYYTSMVVLCQVSGYLIKYGSTFAGVALGSYYAKAELSQDTPSETPV